jgi:hypothetical protein
MFSADLGVTPSAANYIEDVFSTWLYTGTGANQTITNGIDLSTKGGMVWLKGRSGATDHALYDTARGATFDIASNLTTGQTTQATGLTSFLTSGFSIGSLAKVNTNAATYASWTFRDQAKFFDVVTYTGTGANRTIAHNLGAVPGCIMIKRTDTTAAWAVYHRSLANTQYMVLNTQAAAATGATYWNSTTPTSSVFSLGTSTDVNASGGTYVAYLFAHDAGGFGATGTDNVISCGTFTADGSGNATVSLGYEPQWILVKKTNAVSDWSMFDIMRGFFAKPSTSSSNLSPNIPNAEYSWGATAAPTASGFDINGFGALASCIYIAIRRGPMKTPTAGTSVFSAKLYSATTTSATVTHDVTFDAEINANRTVSVEKFLFVDSLRGINGQVLVSANSNLEASFPTYWSRQSQRTMYAPSTFDGWWASASGTNNHVSYGLVRAPGFFDIVCYTGDGTNPRYISHNLGVVPEMIIAKRRGPNVQNWLVYHSALGAAAGINLNLSSAAANPAFYWYATPTSTQFSTQSIPNASGENYVAYLFATVAGVSKVGSYTGTGTTNQINCGFTGGARFVMIKRTDSTGDWYVWDTARGIIAGNDPYLLLNSLAAEVTGTDYVDTYSLGFEISSTAPAAINANGGSFIFLAIA